MRGHRAAVRRITAVAAAVFILGIFFFGGRALFRHISKQETAEEERTDYDHMDVRIPDRTVSLAMIGNLLPDTAVLNSGQTEDDSYNYDSLFVHTQDRIQEADLALVSEEAILGGSELGLSGSAPFNAGYELGDSLIRAGFDVICHASDHALDMGETGVKNCLNFWRTNYPDITVLGIYDSEEDAETLHAVQVNGITIAILNYTFGESEEAETSSCGVDRLEREQVASDLARVQDVSDFVIVVPHWDTEYGRTPSSEQEEWAEFFLENGVGLVLGTHSQGIQPAEWIEDGDGRRMLIFYSLGSFLRSPEPEPEAEQQAVSALATVTLTRSGTEVSVTDCGVTPLVSHFPADGTEPTVYPLEDYTDELAAGSTLSQQDPDFSPDSCREFCEEVFGDLLTP